MKFIIKLLKEQALPFLINLALDELYNAKRHTKFYKILVSRNFHLAVKRLDKFITQRQNEGK